MASIITATTTSGLTQSADNSGVLQLASGTGNLVTIPSVTGTAMVSGNMPAFSAYLSSTQYPTPSVNTVLQIDTKEFDTANCFNTSTYRFTPNVAGYYQVNGQISVRGATSITRFYLYILKNGTDIRYGTDVFTSANNNGYKSSVSTLIYMNGSTDYLQLVGAVTASSAQFTADSFSSNYFQAFLARAA